MESILRDGFLNPSTVGIPAGELPAVWFSKDQYWEESASRAKLHGGQLVRLSMEETFYAAGGLYRFGMPWNHLTGWPRLARAVGMKTKIQLGLEDTARLYGAMPSDWMGFIGKVHAGSCRIQMMTPEFDWIDFDPAVFARLLPLIRQCGPATPAP